MSTASDPICRTCRMSMEKGYLPDRGGGQGVSRPECSASPVGQR
jgi:hypothetical protein